METETGLSISYESVIVTSNVKKIILCTIFCQLNQLNFSFQLQISLYLSTPFHLLAKDDQIQLEISSCPGRFSDLSTNL